MLEGEVARKSAFILGRTSEANPEGRKKIHAHDYIFERYIEGSRRKAQK